MGYVAFDEPSWVSPWSFGRSDISFSWYQNRAVIAPFLSYQDVCSGTKIHYAHFTTDNNNNEGKVSLLIIKRSKQTSTLIKGTNTNIGIRLSILHIIYVITIL